MIGDDAGLVGGEEGGVQARGDALGQEVKREGAITPAERAELDEASQMNHGMTLLNAKAYQVLQTA
jgi:hypothetical protein